MSIDKKNPIKIEVNDEGLKPDTNNVSTTSFEGGELYTSDAYSEKHRASIPRGADKSNLESGAIKDNEIGGLPHSSFSDYHLFRLKTVNGDNYPLTNKEAANHKETLFKSFTPFDLVKNPKGASVYKAEDFLYVERFNKLPINRMVTLRRFAFPIVDDIFNIQQDYDEPDISRMVTYTDQETNKLQEIMGFSMGMRWKELKSSMEEMQMHGASAGVGGHMKNILKFVDPVFGQDQLRGDTALSFNPMHDSNKVYGMVDSIDSNHIRDVGLNFDQDIKLTFKYKLRSINGINGKAAFLDLLSNILLCCTNDAKFWGGARFWRGRRPTQYMKNLKFLSPTSFNDFLNKSHVEFKGFLGSGSGDNKKEALKMLKNVAGNVFNMGFGKLLDKIGRPAIPFSNSLLTGNPVGNWHVTIGNPMNPSMAIGNLLLTNTTIQFGENLGFDDFPEDITVECTLKHAMPRGRAEIEQMFTAGKGRMYWKPKDVFGSINNKVDIPNQFGNINTKTVSDFVDSGYTKFGNFDKKAVLRNAEAVWSFDKVKK